jgi:hypothetical protein
MVMTEVIIYQMNAFDSEVEQSELEIWEEAAENTPGVEGALPLEVSSAGSLKRIRGGNIGVP